MLHLRLDHILGMHGVRCCFHFIIIVPTPQLPEVCLVIHCRRLSLELFIALPVEVQSSMSIVSTVNCSFRIHHFFAFVLCTCSHMVDFRSLKIFFPEIQSDHSWISCNTLLLLVVLAGVSFSQVSFSGCIHKHISSWDILFKLS